MFLLRQYAACALLILMFASPFAALLLVAFAVRYLLNASGIILFAGRGSAGHETTHRS